MGAHAWIREYYTQREDVDGSAGGLDELLAVADSAGVVFAAAATKTGITGLTGVNAGTYKLLVNGHPDLPSTSATVEAEKASGSSDMVEEDIQSTVAKPSEFTLELDGNAYLTSYFMSSLLQEGYSNTDYRGVVGALNNTVKRYVASNYPNYMINSYLAFVGTIPKLDFAKTASIIVRGAVANSVKISAEEGQILKLSVNIMGAYWNNNFTLTPSGNTIAPKIAYLKWQNAKVWIDDAYITAATPSSGLKEYADPIVDATNVFALQGFDLTIVNNLMAKFYNSESVQCFILGKVKANGTLNIPWVVPSAAVEADNYYWNNIDDFRNGIVKHIRIQWGQTWGNDATASDGALVIEAYIKYTDGKVEGEDVLSSALPFTCVRPDMTTPAFQVKFGLAYSGINATNHTALA